MKARHFPLVVCLLAGLAGAPRVSAQSYKQSIPLPRFSGQSWVPEVTPDRGGPQATSFLVSVPRIQTDMIPLPVPVDPNDMLMQDAFNRSDFGSGFGISSVTDAGDSEAVFRLVPNVKLDGYYDSGNPLTTGLSPSSFALQGSAASRASGRFNMQESSANLKTDVQVPDFAAQIYLEIQSVEFDRLDFRQVFGRVGNWLGGAYFSSFTDSGTLPQTIVTNGAPAGAIYSPKIVQLQYARLFQSGVLIGAAIENPNPDDFTLVNPAQDQRLKRVPDVVARIRYQPLDGWGSVQSAVLFRTFGYEELNTTEHFANAVSVSTNARFRTLGDDNIRLGFVGGNGAGSRIFGLNAARSAAGPEGGDLESLQNIGAYASYQHFWSEQLWSNVAYGYAFADVTAAMADATRHSENGWANLIWNNSAGKIAIGFEYQFGQQEVGDGRLGINHHIQLSLQIGKGYTGPSGSPGGSSSPSGASLSAADSSGGTAASAGPIYPRL